jgi:hypothetical protein
MMMATIEEQMDLIAAVGLLADGTAEGIAVCLKSARVMGAETERQKICEYMRGLESDGRVVNSADIEDCVHLGEP